MGRSQARIEVPVISFPNPGAQIFPSIEHETMDFLFE